MAQFIQCRECDPLRRDVRHRNEKLERTVERLFTDIIPLTALSSAITRNMRGQGESTLFRIAWGLRILAEREITSENEPQIFNRTLVLVRACRAREIPCRVFMCGSLCTKFFSLTLGNKKLIFDELPTLPLDLDDAPLAHKFRFKERMLSAGFPVPLGRVCRSEHDVREALQEIGYPIVVKPAFGSQSKHTRCNITTQDEALAAFASARLFGEDVLVEQYIPGVHYRVTVLDGRVIACCMREAPNVIGDGMRSIRELIERKNADPRRGHPTRNHHTIHTIVPTERTDRMLESAGYTHDTVLPEGVKVYLHTKTILSGGADIHDRTDVLHPDTRALFERIGRELDFPLLGFDVICTDIVKPWNAQTFSILECNTKPSIDVHHYPVTGDVQDAAGAVIDYIVEKYRT